MSSLKKISLACSSTLFASPLFAAGSSSAVNIISYYKIILGDFLGLDAHAVSDWAPVLGALVSLTILTIVGLCYKGCVEKLGDNVAPDSKVSVRSVVESLLDFITDLGSGIIGESKVAPFLPLLAGLFFFIFVSNMTGLVPGFLPATDSLNTNLAMGIMVFLVYNYAGIKEHGAAYVKQFLGPVLFLMPLMLVIEVIGHLARPVSLSLRLYGNIFGDHLVLSVFTGLTVLVFPAAFLFFGLLVASLQSFVFTLLTSIYISMAMSHDH